MSKPNRYASAVIRSPLLWGSLAALGFYALIQTGAVQGEFLHRYFASHPVEYITTVMFFIGLAAVVLRWFDVAGQFKLLAGPLLAPMPATPEPPNACHAHLAALDALPAEQQTSYLVRRLREALEHVRQKGSADTIDEQLKYLAESDALRSQSGHALTMIIVWAIPILGFLGTVIGITLAIANLSPEALESSLPEVTAGLGTAFDTTALALALSMVLMFIKFAASREENRLLAAVDARAMQELGGRFAQGGVDAQAATVGRITAALVQATERLMAQQVQLWRKSIDAARDDGTQLMEAARRQLQSELENSVERGLDRHAQRLAEAEAAQSEQNRRHWAHVAEALSESTAAIRDRQGELIEQGEMLRRTVEAAGKVATLEDALNRNLHALASSQRFEEMLLNLSATINLLNARLGAAGASAAMTGHVQKAAARPGQAA